MSDLSDVFSYQGSNPVLSENVLNRPPVSDFEYFSTLFNHSFNDNPTLRGYRALSAGIADTEGEKKDVNYLNENYGIEGLIQFDKPISEKRAMYERDVALARRVREEILAEGEFDHTQNGLAKLATSFTAGMLDPINIGLVVGSMLLAPTTTGASLLPLGSKALGVLSGNILPATARNALVSKLGTGIATKAVEGLVEGAAGALIPEGAALGLMKGVGVQEEYTAEEFGMNVAGGAIFGGLLGGGVGFVSKFKKPNLTQAVQIDKISETHLNDKLTIASQQLLTDKPINTQEIDLIHNIAKKQKEGRANAILEKKALAEIPIFENLRNDINLYYGDSVSSPMKAFSNEALSVIETSKSFEELSTKWEALESKYPNIAEETPFEVIEDVENIPDFEEYINQANEQATAEIAFRNSINEALDLRFKELLDNEDFQIRNQNKIDLIQQVKGFLDDTEDYFVALLEDINIENADFEESISDGLDNIADEYQFDNAQRLAFKSAFQDILTAPATAEELKKVLNGDITTLRTLLKEAKDIQNANIETLRSFDSGIKLDDSLIETETDIDESFDNSKLEFAKKQADEILDLESKAELEEELKALELEEKLFNEELKVQQEITNCFVLNGGNR